MSLDPRHVMSRRSAKARRARTYGWSLCGTGVAGAVAGLGAWALHRRRTTGRGRLRSAVRHAQRIRRKLSRYPETRHLAVRGIHLATRALDRAMDEAERRLHASGAKRDAHPEPGSADAPLVETSPPTE